MGTTSSIKGAKFGEERTTRTGCRCENMVFLCFYRQDAANIFNLLTGQKPGFFASEGRLVAPIHVKLGMADGHLGPLGCAKFYLTRRRGVGGNAAPKISKKIFQFSVKRRPAGANLLTDFKNFFFFIRLNYPTLAFQI